MFTLSYLIKTENLLKINKIYGILQKIFLKEDKLNNLPLIIGLLSTIILSLYCVDFHTEPILDRLNHKVAQSDYSKTTKAKSYVKVMAKPIKNQIIEKSEAIPVLKKVESKKDNELDILAKKILEDMNKNKD